MFLSLSDEEKKTFLSEILGINSFDTASDTSSNTIKSLENQILVKENQINNLNGQIDMLRKVNNLDPKTILDIDSKIEENEHNMSTLVSQIDMLNIEKDLFLAKMRDVDEMYTHRASQVANISREIIKNSSENKKKQLEESIELINLQQKLDELDVQYKNIDFNSKTINDEIQKTSKSIENSNLMINKISYEIDSTKKDIKNIELTIIDLESDVNCGACGQPITDLQKQSINIKIENLKLNQNNLKNKLNTQLDDLNRLKKHQLEHLSPSKYQLEQELLDLTKKTDEWTISRNENRSLFEIIKQNIIKKFDDDIILAQEKYLAEQKEITVQKDKETKVLGVQLNGILEQYKVQESLLRTLQYENLSLDK